MEDKVKGKVKWFNKEKGYGFINQENDDVDIFVHYSQILIKGYKELFEGDLVNFCKSTYYCPLQTESYRCLR